MLRWLLLVLVLAGCASAPPPDPLETATVRTDRDPISARFPLLGTGPVRWIGGTFGDDRVPGPSLYFVEAVLELAPPDVERLADAYPLAPADGPPVPGPLRDAVDPGAAWTSAPGLDAVAGPEGWATRVFVDPAARLAYVSARGE